MNRSALCVLLGLQLANCRGINETASNTWQLEWPSWAASNSTICTQEWESVADSPNLCKIYNWFGGLTNLFRKTGEVVSEFSPYYGNQVKPEAGGKINHAINSSSIKSASYLDPRYSRLR